MNTFLDHNNVRNILSVPIIVSMFCNCQQIFLNLHYLSITYGNERRKNIKYSPLW